MKDREQPTRPFLLMATWQTQSWPFHWSCKSRYFQVGKKHTYDQEVTKPRSVSLRKLRSEYPPMFFDRNR